MAQLTVMFPTKTIVIEAVVRSFLEPSRGRCIESIHSISYGKEQNLERVTKNCYSYLYYMVFVLGIGIGKWILWSKKPNKDKEEDDIFAEPVDVVEPMPSKSQYADAILRMVRDPLRLPGSFGSDAILEGKLVAEA